MSEVAVETTLPQMDQLHGALVAKPLPSSFDQDIKQKKILVVDDDDEIRQVLKDYLTMRGHSVEAAENGRHAMEILSRSHREYSVVFTDLNMPAMNGFELLENIARLNRDITQIVITGNATRLTAITSLKSGAYDFIEKPFQLRELEATLARALEKYRLVQENREYQQHLELKVAERTEELLSLNTTLTSLCKLGQKSRETLNIQPKLTDFRDFCIDTFAPDTFVLYTRNGEQEQLHRNMYYDAKGRGAIGFESPPLQWLSLSEPRLTLHRDDQAVPRQFRIQPANRSAHIFRLEQDLLLGFLYLGFDERTEIARNEPLLDLYLGEVESALIHDYLIASHREEFRRMFLSSVMTHARTIEVKDCYTRGHCERVERYVNVLASEMDLDDERKYNLKIACILHDIGKIGVSETIISKPGKLTEEEYESMKMHPVLGGKIVKNLYGFDLEKIIRHHHENFDGSGYPDGLDGDEIPLESRIMAVMDTFDAMTTNRPYRRGRSLDETVAEIERCSGTQFDPMVVSTFLGCLDKIVKVQQETSQSLEGV
jgi:response regulator RpfG family c-di-GMP phosphodiesterase